MKTSVIYILSKKDEVEKSHQIVICSPLFHTWNRNASKYNKT